jgi:hypothetical protein
MRPIDQLDETNWSTRRDQLIYQKRSINKPDKTNWTPFWFKYPFKLHTNRQRWRMNSKCCNSKVLILYFFTWWNITRLYIYKSYKILTLRQYFKVCCNMKMTLPPFLILLALHQINSESQNYSIMDCMVGWWNWGKDDNIHYIWNIKCTSI